MKKIKVYNQAGDIVFNNKIMNLQLPEHLVIEKSIKWFNDPDPCFIHKSAVMKRLFIELEDHIIKESNTKVLIEELPETLQRMFEKYEGSTRLCS